MNKFITSEINNWDCEYDPYNFFDNEYWYNAINTSGLALELYHIYNGKIIRVFSVNNGLTISLYNNNILEKEIPTSKSEINSILCNLISEFAD